MQTMHCKHARNQCIESDVSAWLNHTFWGTRKVQINSVNKTWNYFPVMFGA